MKSQLICMCVFCFVRAVECLIEPKGSQQFPSNEFLQQLDYRANLINTFLTPSHHINRTCVAFLAEFAEHSSTFIKCVIDNARPFRLCETCVEPFKKSSTIFTDLTAYGACYKQIVMADRVQVVKLVYESIRTVWTSANCRGCFSSITEDVNATVIATKTNSTVQFVLLFEDMIHCLNTTDQQLVPLTDGNSTFCIKCRPEYRSLNAHFTEMMGNSSSEVCMDVVDMMNYTRLMWSKTYHCSHRKGDQVPILVIATLICSLPVIFYTVNRLTGQRTARTIVVQKRMKQPNTGSYGSTMTSSVQRTVSFSQSLS